MENQTLSFSNLEEVIEVAITQDLEERVKKLEPKERIHVVIKLKEWQRSYIQQILDEPNCVLRHVIPLVKSFSLSLPVEKVLGLAEKPGVLRAEWDKKVYASLDSSLPLIGVSAPLLEQGFSGKGVKVAVIDTGVDRFHPDLEGRIVGIADFTLEGFQDFNGHGTHTAGVIGADGEKSEGKYRGVAPESLILAAKALKADGSGRASDAMAALEWALEAGAQVVNLALGAEGPCDGNDSLSETCDAVVAQGVVVCVAAGNEGPNRGSIGSPGCARGVITVGASNDQDRVAEFSARGPTLDGRTKPDVLAPGTGIVSGRAKEVSMGKPVDDFYTSATGTSMAASQVSGLVALLLGAKAQSSPGLIKEALTHTAKNLNVEDYAQGAGRIQAEAALEYIKTHDNPPEIAHIEHKGGYLGTLMEVGHLLSQKLRRKEKGNESKGKREIF